MSSFAIILNGTSSSGKTSIAKEIQRQWGEPIFHASIDTFTGMVAHRLIEDKEKRKRVLMACATNLNRFLQSFRSSEFPVIVDIVFDFDDLRTGILSSLEGIPLFLVGLRCCIEELERREKNRGNRKLGLAKWQNDIVHSNIDYDLEIDTEQMLASAAASAIITAVRKKFGKQGEDKKIVEQDKSSVRGKPRR